MWKVSRSMSFSTVPALMMGMPDLDWTFSSNTTFSSESGSAKRYTSAPGSLICSSFSSCSMAVSSMRSSVERYCSEISAAIQPFFSSADLAANTTLFPSFRMISKACRYSPSLSSLSLIWTCWRTRERHLQLALSHFYKSQFWIKISANVTTTLLKITVNLTVKDSKNATVKWLTVSSPSIHGEKPYWTPHVILL